MKIAFIGFGEAASAFRDSLADRDAALQFAAYDTLLGAEGLDGRCGSAMRERGVDAAATVGQAIDRAQWVFSAVTADQSLAALQSAAPYMRPGQVFFEINSVSPQRKRDNAGLLGPSGSTYVDMAVMGPVHPNGHRTPALLAGAINPSLARQMEDLAFSFAIAGSNPGEATAIKMIRSVFMKGLEAVMVESFLAAAASGCLDAVVESLERSFPGLRFSELAPYFFERTLKHGKRRAAEMRECALTLNELNLDGRLAAAIAEVQDAMGGLPVQKLGADDFTAELRKIAALRRVIAS